MSLVFSDRVQETTTVSGTSNATLLGAVTGFQSFAVLGDGNTTYYSIVGPTEWEIGIGTYSTTGPTLTRDTILSSSNSNAKVSFSAGTKNIFITYPASIANTTLTPQVLTINNNNATIAAVNNINGAPGNVTTGGWLLPQSVTLSTLAVKLNVGAKGTSLSINLKYSTNGLYTSAVLLKNVVYSTNKTTLQTTAVTNTLPAQSTLYVDLARVGSSYPGAGLTIQIGYKYV